MDYSLRTRAKARDYIGRSDPNVVVGLAAFPTAIDRRYRKCYVSPDVDIEETILPGFWKSNGKVPVRRGKLVTRSWRPTPTHLLPYDFSLTAEQEADLFAEVRTTLQGDDELFSVVIRHMMEEL